jgi:hypothetical protein
MVMHHWFATGDGYARAEQLPDDHDDNASAHDDDHNAAWYDDDHDRVEYDNDDPRINNDHHGEQHDDHDVGLHR